MTSPGIRTAALLGLLALALGAASCATPPSPPPAPPPPVVEKPRPPERWVISPAQGYDDRYGYVRLEYIPPGPPGVPPGGRLLVDMGRQGLSHANTAWYRFEVREGTAVLLDQFGEEGIPNVKGPDGNWWTDEPLDLPRPLRGPLSVTVDDGKTGITYAFEVRGE
jgi:hypothetical protein